MSRAVIVICLIALGCALGCGQDEPAPSAAPDMAPPTDAPADADLGAPPPLDQPQDQPDAPPSPDMRDDAPLDADMSEPPGGRSLYAPAGAFFTRDVSQQAPSPESAQIIAALRAAGGWGNNDRFQIDLSLTVLQADANTPKRTFEQTGDFYTPDCDPAPVPVPEGGSLEGEEGYACEGDGDCHLIVHAPHEQRLYEMWRADLRGDQLRGGCLAIWDTSRVYPEQGRGEQCTSADAAGFPIAPLLFTADEVAAGEIPHAIRFILPNDRVRASAYVRPATHGTRTTGGPNTPPYGVHLRLRADYPLQTLPNEGARVVARALQRYGMYHADGGQIALTAQSDRNTTAKWEGLLGTRDLAALRVEDFEVLSPTETIPVTFDCERIPITQ